MSLRIAVIGAGLAGVGIARELAGRGMEVVLFEKSRGLGGRCAAKRWEGHVIDHGAQYFTIRDERFRRAVQAASGKRVTELIAPVVCAGSGEPENSSEARWFHGDGNSRLVRDLAHGLEVQFGAEIGDARPLLRANGGGFDHVVSTAPWPQTARLFGLEPGASGYVPCLTVLLAYHGVWPGRTRSVYAFRDRDPAAVLAWSACENHKPDRIAPGFTVLVAQLGEAFSREHLERPAEEYPELVRSLVEGQWEISGGALAAALGHRWRYARVTAPLPIPDLPRGLHFVGDARRASRVEDAWLAGVEFASSGAWA